MGCIERNRLIGSVPSQRDISFVLQEGLGWQRGAIRQGIIPDPSGPVTQGCQVFSFKQPSTEELKHDFLWRTTCRLPERGSIGIFNRSYYEEVLIVRVHPEILDSQGLPDELLDEKTIWEERYRSIVDLVDISIVTAPGSSSCSSTFRRTNSESDSSSALMNRTKTGNSVLRHQERKFWNDYMKAYEDA